MNMVALVGRIASDVELRYSKNGNAIVYFALAVDKPYYARTEDSDAVFPRVVVFGKLGEILAEHKEKGDLISLTGWINTRSYETEDGEIRYITEIVGEDIKFLDFRRGSGNGNGDNKKSKQTKGKKRR